MVMVVVLVAVVATGVAVAATFSLSTPHLGAGQVTTPVLWADTMALTDKGGAGHKVGQTDAGDTINVTYSEVLAKTNFCTGWTGATAPTVTVKGNKGGSGVDDTITLDQTTLNMTCTGGLHFGSIDLGSTGFFNTAVTFATSTVSLSGTPSKLTITLGTKSGTVVQLNATRTATFTPDPALSDSSGHAIGASTCVHVGVLF